MLLNTQTRIGALLHEDHMATIESLQRLDDFLGRHRTAPRLDPDGVRFLTALARTLREEVESHFAFEEEHLFPEFTRRGETGIVVMLTMEHRAILPLAVRVADLAAAAAQAGWFGEQEWRDFRDNGAELVEREIFHLQKEEMGLIGAISALVDGETDARLAEVYRQTVG